MTNWRTTVCGLVIAGAQAISTYQGNGGWKGYLVAAGIAAFGWLAKDFAVSGTTTH